MIDIAKALAMISIIVAHSKIIYVQNIMYMYMVPAFFFFAGYVFNYSDKTVDGSYCLTYARKKIAANWAPFVEYSALFILLHNVFLRIGIYTADPSFATLTAENEAASLWGGRVQELHTFRDGIGRLLRAATFDITEEFTRPLWFLPALFTANIAIVCVFFLSEKTKKRILEPLAVGVLFTVGYLTHLPRYISSGLVGVIFVYAGYLFRKNQKKIPYKLWLFIVSGGIVLYLSRRSTLGMISNVYTSPVTLLLSSACGLYCILCAAKWIEKNSAFLSKHLAFYGRNTLIALAFHLLFFKCVTVIQIVAYASDWIYLACYPVFHAQLPWPILYSVVGVAGTYLMALMDERVLKKGRDRIRNILFRRG